MSERTAHKIRERQAIFHDKMREVAGEGYEIEVLRESFANVVQDLLRFEDENWVDIFGGVDKQVKGFTLDDVKKTTTYLEKQTKILGDLLGRGLRLKNNHAIGRGFTYEPIKGKSKIAPRHQEIIDNPYNQESVFSPTALKDLNRVIFTSGNIILLWKSKEQTFQRLAVDVNVENYITYEDDPTRIKYFLRSWVSRDDISAFGRGANGEPRREWVPTSSYDSARGRKPYPKTIDYNSKPVPVNPDNLIIAKHYNRDNGETWGVPDAFAAAAPAHVYAQSMKNGAMLQHALAAISFVVKARTEAAAKSAGAKIQNGKVGQAAITGPETEIQSMPRAGSINMYESRPLVARVAAALDVSTTGITSDPGPGGSYASENALSAPEQMAALSRQEDFVNLFAEIFRVMKADATINFKRLDVDPVHRQMQSLVLASEAGFIHQQEGRDRSLELLDIEPTSTDLPEPTEFTGSKASTLQANLDLQTDLAAQDAAAAASSVPRQGQSGSVGSLDDNNSSRDATRDSGTA